MAERPVECSHCKKPIHVIYKEAANGNITCTEMCGECPVLQQKLHGDLLASFEGKAEDAGLCCGTCGTTLTSIKMGTPLGCAECYTLFGDVLAQELMARGAISPRFKQEHFTKKGKLLHVGKTPSQNTEMTHSSRLTSLNEALNDALKRENYEQAAWLRDQIKDLMEKPGDGKTNAS